jgi:D-sedoheptulose 7-phosphate isomerase
MTSLSTIGEALAVPEATAPTAMPGAPATGTVVATTRPRGCGHLDALAACLDGLSSELPKLARWSEHLAQVLNGGGRLLVAGNGGSAAQAQHLSAELVGRYCEDREGFSAIALHAETSSVTAIVNDYGAAQVFARQVRAHGRRADVLLTLSTSGKSSNLLAAARAAADVGVTSWALTGPRPNPLAEVVDDAICVGSPNAPTVQEAHLVLVHLLCSLFDESMGGRGDGLG